MATKGDHVSEAGFAVPSGGPGAPVVFTAADPQYTNPDFGAIPSATATIVVAGMYDWRLSGQYVTPPAACNTRLSLWVNGAVYREDTKSFPANFPNPALACNGITYFNMGDQVSVTAYQNSGVALPLNADLVIKPDP